MRALQALRGLSRLGSLTTLDVHGVEAAAGVRGLSSSSGLKEALAEKIPQEQVGVAKRRSSACAATRQQLTGWSASRWP